MRLFASAMIFGLLVLLALPRVGQAGFYCKGMTDLILDNGKKETFCDVGIRAVSKACYLHPEGCALLSELKHKLPGIRKKYNVYDAGNPGAYVCRLLGWKVVTGKNHWGNVCLCEHPEKELAICTTIYLEKKRAK